MIKVLCDVMQHIFQLFTHVMQCLSQGWRTCGLGEHFMWPTSNCATYDRVQHRV